MCGVCAGHCVTATTATAAVPAAIACLSQWQLFAIGYSIAARLGANVFDSKGQLPKVFTHGQLPQSSLVASNLPQGNP